MASKARQEGEGENPASERFDFDIVERHGVRFFKSDLEALETTERVTVFIRGDEIGFQMNEQSNGKRQVKRTIHKDPRTGEEFIFWNKMFLTVEEEFHDGESLGFYSAKEQSKSARIDGDWVVGLPDAEAYFDLRREHRGPREYMVVSFKDGERQITYGNLDARTAAEFQREQRENGRESHIVHEDDFPEDFDTTTYPRDEWDVVLNTTTPSPSDDEDDFEEPYDPDEDDPNKEYKESVNEATKEEHEDPDKCPKCGSTDVKVIRVWENNTEMICKACGHEFDTQYLQDALPEDFPQEPKVECEECGGSVKVSNVEHTFIKTNPDRDKGHICPDCAEDFEEGGE